MTDEDILKRLAEIENLSVCEEWNCALPESTIFIRVGASYLKSWSPVIDWSDLGPLIEKHGVTCIWLAHDKSWKTGAEPKHEEHWSWVVHESLPHAALLAIIEANK